MAEKKIKIEWSEEAAIQFDDILDFLYKESEAAVRIVRKAILDSISHISKYPTANPLDRFKKNNNGKFRACLVYSYRISYYVDDDTIYILRIRHTSREPLEY